MKQVNPKKYHNTLYFEEAVETKGWWQSHRFLILRRCCQIMIILLFALPIGGMNHTVDSDQLTVSLEIHEYESGVRKDEVWLLKGTLANSEILSTIPMGDPFVFVQSLAAGNLYTLTGMIGVGLVILFYMMLGGRTYCSFVCPINIVTDAAAWIRRQLKISNQLSISRRARFYILGIAILISMIFQVIAWELINPITGIFRALVFSGFAITNIAVVLTLVIFILDIIGAANLWCGHLCPVGAFYSLLGKKTRLYISAPNISACDDCMDCYKVCPEPHVLKPILRDREIYSEQSIVPSIGFSDCTRCGRCLDVCPEKVFSYDFSAKHFVIQQNKPKVKVGEL